MDETVGRASPEASKSSEAATDVFSSPSKSLCLSTALESLALVYLPQTKQLVAAPGWPRVLDQRHHTDARSRGRAASPDVPEFSFPIDGGPNGKSMAGSKLSEDSGYPGLWDSDTSLSAREVLSERNSSVGSSDILECDLEVDDTETDDNTSEFTKSHPYPSHFLLGNNALSAPEEMCSADGIPTPVQKSKDLQTLSVSDVSVVEDQCTSCSTVPTFSRETGASTVECQAHKVDKPRRGVFASLFTGAIFGVRGRSQQDPAAAERASNCMVGNQIETKQEIANSRGPSNFFVFKKSDVEKSTTALILQERPKGLPLKDPGEEARHRSLYQAMVEEAKQKERKDAKRQRQKMKEQLKQESLMANALKIWNNEILPNWETAKYSKRANELWWTGVPPRIRGRVWQLAIGNELNVTAELYEICLVRAKERLRILKDPGSDSDSLSSLTESTISRESSVELIRLDVSRTFPSLCIFQKGGPYHDLLQGLLASYACYRPDVGYVQGMSFIAAMLLLNMEVADAFICFANLLNKPCLLAFFRLDRSQMDAYFETFQDFFREKLPRLHQHMTERGVTPDLYLLDWLFTLYAKSLSLDVVSRVWDVHFRDGEEFIFRTALGILKMYEEVLLNLDFIQLAQFLTRLPTDVPCDDLFRCIATVSMEIDKRQFAQVLQQHREIPVT